MSLQKYRSKRNFEQSTEPSGVAAETEKGDGPLRFVVHRHQATRLHYDLRLELDGVLKSWAIPKGPTLDADEKRLAVMVEDHPLAYRTFEGVIPSGSYGAGKVEIWDEGEYHWAGEPEWGRSTQAIREGLKNGHISVVLEGRKLQGEFALVRLKKSKEKDWLLIKKHDLFSRPGRLTDDPVTPRGRTKDGSGGQRKSAGGAFDPEAVPVNLDDVPPGEMPLHMPPMLATLVEEPFDRQGWLFELKWDGYRAIAEILDHRVRLHSRNDRTLNEQFPALVESLADLPFGAVLDGEIVVLDQEGRASFQLLQKHLRAGGGLLVYYVFDVIYLEGHDLSNLPLRRRKDILARILPELPHIRISDYIEEKGVSLFRAVQENGVEGIVAKNGASVYQAGTRSRDWLKIKTSLRQEAVIGGFTAPRGGRKHLGSLLLGVYDGPDLVYIGRSGGGFTDDELADAKGRLLSLRTTTSPFAVPPRTDTQATWVKPELVCEVRFAEWTDDGLMRHPVFLGLRDDISPLAVGREKPEKATALDGHAYPAQGKDGKRIAVRGVNLNLTNLEKAFWPDEGYTKGDMIEYYRAVAPVILPYLKDRPETMHRFPDGIAGPAFFQKHVDEKMASWLETVSIFSEGEGKEIRYLLCQDEASLLYMANLGCIEIHPWNSRYGTPDRPDYLVLDIDPLDIDFSYAVEAALTTREVIELAGAQGFCKTSGATGLHIFIPLGAKYTTDQAVQFAHLINLFVHRRLPKTTSLERAPVRRPGKVYLDYLQNRRGATMAAPYCLRPRRGAPVSAPLRWDEVNGKLRPSDFHMRNMPARIAEAGDLWQGVLRNGIDMESCLERLSSRV